MQQQIRNNIRGRVLDHVANHTPESKTSIYWKRILGAGCIIISTFTAILSLSFFAQTASTSMNFTDYIGSSLSGIIWMWLPETLLVTIISLLTCFAGYTFLNVSRISRSVIATGVGYACLALLFISVPTANVFADNTFYESLITSEYRLSMRDTYISEELDTSREYFGVVHSVSCQRGISEQVTINHGGVIKGFEDPNALLCSSTKAGDLIWVRYDGNKMITDGKVL